MRRTVEAVYRDGALVLRTPLPVKEASTVILDLVVPDQPVRRRDEEEASLRLLMGQPLFGRPEQRPPLEW